jgi:hypothetical protein
LTTARRGASIGGVTVRHGVIHASVPCSVALYTCSCGASTVEFDVRLPVPDGWSAVGNDTVLCPHCARNAAPASNSGR